MLSIKFLTLSHFLQLLWVLMLLLLLSPERTGFPKPEISSNPSLVLPRRWRSLSSFTVLPGTLRLRCWRLCGKFLSTCERGRNLSPVMVLGWRSPPSSHPTRMWTLPCALRAWQSTTTMMSRTMPPQSGTLWRGMISA